jgi:hypothetical protein
VKQVVQDFRTGNVRLVEVPPPALRARCVRVRTVASVVSPGTERMLVALARRSLVGKAKDRPDLVARVWRKLKRDGLASALRTVKDRLGAPVPLGYAAAGVVTDAGDVAGLVVGDRVACAGAGWANHAEVNVVPRNLVARVPEGVARPTPRSRRSAPSRFNAARGPRCALATAWPWSARASSAPSSCASSGPPARACSPWTPSPRAARGPPPTAPRPSPRPRSPPSPGRRSPPASASTR